MRLIFLLRNASHLLFQGAVNEFNLPLAAGGLFSNDACRPFYGFGLALEVFGEGVIERNPPGPVPHLT